MNTEINRNIIFILHVIKNDLSIDFLRNLGLEYSQIANLIDTLIEQNLIGFAEQGDMILTDFGLNTLNKLSEKSYAYLSSTKILPEEWARIDKNTISDVYLPKKKVILKLEEES